MADKALNKQFEQFTKMQQESLDKLKSTSTATVDFFEQLARFQTELVGDAVEFAVGQARLATTSDNPSDYVKKQIEAATAYGETVAKRTGQYVDLLSKADGKKAA